MFSKDKNNDRYKSVLSIVNTSLIVSKMCHETLPRHYSGLKRKEQQILSLNNKLKEQLLQLKTGQMIFTHMSNMCLNYFRPMQMQMSNSHGRKLKQKIARRMVTFNALNDSRPRTDIGQPMTHEQRRRLMSQQTFQLPNQLLRALSDPDLYGKRPVSEGSLSSRFSDVNEMFSPYTAIGSHEDINQRSVHEILSNFEHKHNIEHMVTQSNSPYQNCCSCQVASKPPPVVKPTPAKKPVPAPRFNSSKEGVFCLKKDSDISGSVNQTAVKPKPKPRPHTMISNVSEQHLSVKRNKFKKQNSDGVVDSLAKKKIRSTPTRHRSHTQEVMPYDIVNLSAVTSRQTEGILVNLSTDKVDDYLTPIDGGGMSSKKSSSMYKQFTPSNRKSVTEIQNGFYQKMRRSSSLPDILVADSSYYANVSNDVSDEDIGWDSDEFDSEEENEDYAEIKMPIDIIPHLDASSKKLYNIVSEILSTERAYVKRLHLLDKIFQDRILQEAKENGVIPEKAVSEIFSNLSSIHRFHSTILLPDLEKRIGKDWFFNPKIGDIFITVGHCLVLYTDFVKNFDNAITTLNYWLKKSLKFASLIAEIQQTSECEKLTLQHHMLEPVQRVPRYKLLLNDYLKKLPNDSPDFKESRASLDIISKAADNANNSMKENDKFKTLLTIQDRISEGLNGDSLVTASRVFLKEGELIKQAARSGNRSPRTILLFNDFLLCCSTTATGKLRVRQIMDVIGLSIVPDGDGSLPEHSMRIRSRQRVLDLITKSEDEKRDWMEAINAAVSEIDEKRGTIIRQAIEDTDSVFNNKDRVIGQQAPLWVKDEDVTMCMLCALKFGLVRRKHHCRGCGRITCDKCSNYRARLPYADNEMHRLCCACFKKLGLGKNEETDEQNDLRNNIRARDSNSSADVCGVLYWKPPGKGWTKEYIVLSQFVLYVQKKKQDVKAHFTLPVPSFDVDQPSSMEEIETGHPFCIKLHKGKMKELTYYLSSDNKETIETWENHLRSAVLMRKYDENEAD